MEIMAKFTLDELKLISKALILGLVHVKDNEESKKMEELENKIQKLQAFLENGKT